ncbi:MAG: 3-deoxy-manno-octulosonate cytidylyltransferase [Gemmatimonadaceae bacterium]|nr:3-deoxy-manno-octulosonate cytidylyltransferase [Gemmatimonadaceae bacterium]
MTVLAVIPARLAATRLPNKPLRLLGGLPLVIRVWERVSALGIADRVVIATDADAVLAVAREAGADAVRTRDDHASGTDRVAEVTRAEPDDTIVLNVQGDEPFVSRAALSGAVAMVRAGFDTGTACVPCSAAEARSPHVVKVVRGDDGRALYFSRATVPFARDAADIAVQEALLRRHVGVYAYTARALARWVAWPVHPLEACERLEQLRPLAHGLSMGVALVDDAGAPGIDTEADLTAANSRWPAFAHTPGTPHPEGARA